MKEQLLFSQLYTSRVQRRVIKHHCNLISNSVFLDKILHECIFLLKFRVVNLWILMNNPNKTYTRCCLLVYEMRSPSFGHKPSLLPDYLSKVFTWKHVLTERKQKSPVTFLLDEREFILKSSSWVGNFLQRNTSISSQNKNAIPQKSKNIYFL